MAQLSFRKILLVGLLSGTAIAPLTANAQSAKAPELYFYPTQKWSVVQQGEKCAINSSFNNGFVIGFSGEARWVEALNINFRQDIFEKGNTYKAKVTVPGVASQDISAKATNTGVLKLNFRNRKDLYQQIRTSSVLDLKIEGNEFRFYLTGFAATAGGFEKCMSGSVAAPAPDKMETTKTETDDIPAMPMPEEESRPDRLVSSSRDLFKPDMQSATVNEAMELEQQIKSDAEKPRERLSEKIYQDILENPDIIAIEDNPAPKSAPIARNKPLEVPPELDTIELVEETGTSPKEVMESAPEQKDVVAELEAQAAPEVPKEKPETQAEKPPENIEWNEPIALLEEDKAEELKEGASKEEEKQVEALTPEAETMKEEAEDMASMAEPKDVDPPKAEPVTHSFSTPPMKVNRETASIEADFTKLEPASADDSISGARNDALLAKISVMEEKMQALKNENSALNDDLKSSLRASEKERMSIASENWNLERATMKFNEAERQIKRLGQQLQTERAKCNVEKKELETMLFDPQLTQESQLARLAGLEEDLDEAQRELETQRQRYEEQIKILKAQGQ